MEEGSNVDCYDPSFQGGRVSNLENHIRFLDTSLSKSRPKGGLFSWINERLQAEDDEADIITTVSELDTNTRFVVLSHGTQDDPIYNYANEAALIRFEHSLDVLCTTPSRCTTVPELRNDRRNKYQAIETIGYGYIDDAIRLSAKGNLFSIKRILVWNVHDDKEKRIGLAACFDRNDTEPYHDKEGRYTITE